VSGPQLISDAGVSFPLADGSVIVGRPDPGSGWVPAIDLTTIDPARRSSRRHAEIHVEGNAVTIRDLRSANKTFVNGHPIEPDSEHRLAEGDLVTFGDARLRLQGLTPLTSDAHCPKCHAPTQPDMATCASCGANLSAAVTMTFPPEHPCVRCGRGTRGDDHCEDCAEVLKAIDAELLAICGLVRPA
jgi:predicted component of type VI protein secretion system